jgi:hypothetical protein
MASDNTPATKGDLDALRNDVSVLRRDLQESMKVLKDEIMRHFDLTIETIRHDLLGANRDDIDAKGDHEKRIRKLERATGVVAA